KSGSTGFSTPIVVSSSPTHHSGYGDNGYRWGDYAAVAVDPFDNTFWVSHELVPDFFGLNAWSTAWGNLVFPPALAWTSDGEPVRTSYTKTGMVRVTNDGAGGAMVVWVDTRKHVRFYAQRLTSTGELASGWTPVGVDLGFASADGT